MDARLCPLNSPKAKSVTLQSDFFFIMKKKILLILAQPLKQDKKNNERQRYSIPSSYTPLIGSCSLLKCREGSGMAVAGRVGCFVSSCGGERELQP